MPVLELHLELERLLALREQRRGVGQGQELGRDALVGDGKRRCFRLRLRLRLKLRIGESTRSRVHGRGDLEHAAALGDQERLFSSEPSGRVEDRAHRHFLGAMCGVFREGCFCCVVLF